MNESLLLSPRPWSVELSTDAFFPGAATAIYVGHRPSRAMFHSAEYLRIAVLDLLDLDLAIIPASPSSAQGISLVVVQEGDKPGPEWIDPAPLGPEGYELHISNQGVTIAGNDDAAVFYGIQTLIQIARSSGRRWPGCSVQDKPAVPVRGYLIDITRGKVHSIEALEKLVKTFAHFKCNHLQLYIEHAFDFPSAPEIGHDSGALSPADILRLDQLCKDHHIELAPNFQSLGHQGRLLKVPGNEHLAETPWRFTFATDNDEVFRYLDERYAEFLPCFASRLLNVNADEPWDFGRGQSRAMVEELGIGATYLHHLKQLHELTTRHGCRMAMWADVLKHYPELIPSLPDDILLIDWWYEATDQYKSLAALEASGREFWICAATSSWIALYPRLENSISNIRNYVQQGIAAGATGVLISDWGDSGHDQPLSNSTYPLLWGADCAWTGATTSSEAFDAAYGLHILNDRSGQIIAGMRRIGRAMQADKVWLSGWNSAMALYEDPLVGKVANVTPQSVVLEARDAAIDIQSYLSQIPDPVMRADLGFATRQIVFACDKVENTRSLRNLLRSIADRSIDQTEAIRQLSSSIEVIRSLRNQLPAIVEEFERRWMRSARRSSIQFNLDRYAGLIAQFDRVLAWLNQQLDMLQMAATTAGDISTYDTSGYAVLHEATYYWIKELEAIIGYDSLPSDIKDYLRDAGI